jgi:glycerophosphoryl diester phosphodiesterase
MRRAQALGIPVVEADLHLLAGRVEVRHLKTLGPVPVLWDRWTIAPPWTPRLCLGELLACVLPRTEIMLDLKGRDVRLPGLVAAALAERESGGPVIVCARAWKLLDLLPAAPGLRRVHSVGDRRQLDRLRRRFAGRRLDGISIHRRLLDEETVRDLRDRAELVMSWPVESVEHARQLVRWGVHGLIAERPELLAAALGAPEAAAA